MFATATAPQVSSLSMSAKANQIKAAPLPGVHMIHVKDKKLTASICPMDQESVLSVQFKPTWTSLAEHAQTIVTVKPHLGLKLLSIQTL